MRTRTHHFRRHRRPSPTPATRSQVRQKVDRLRLLYQLEAIVELHRAQPDLQHLADLRGGIGLLDEALGSIEEQL